MWLNSAGLRRSAMLGIIMLSLPLMAANCSKEERGDGAQAEPPKDAAAEANAQGSSKPPAAPGEGKKADEIPVDLYPNFKLGLLSPEERVTFVKIAEAELCPCPDSTQSLHLCFQKMETRCAVAEQAAITIAVGIKEKLSQTDIQDKVAQTMESYKKVHEFDLANAPFKGNADAKIVFVEFADFECPHCRMASQEFKKLAEKHSSKFKVYYKMFPLGRPQSNPAARAALAAHKQGKFWPMHDLIYENQGSLSDEKYERFAQQIGLNVSKFKTDMASPEIAAQVARDRAEGEKAEISGTPAIFMNGRKYMGDASMEGLNEAIDEALAEQK